MEQKPDKPERGADPTPELKKLVELAAKYPEIGPPLAELALKIGHKDIAQQVVRMGLDGDSPGIEYYFVLAHSARREKRHKDALAACVDALKAYIAASVDTLDEQDGNRLLHLVRTGFATLMFELDNVRAEPEFVASLKELLPQLEGRLGSDPFYRTLLAQTYWFDDVDNSEAEWDRAAQMDDSELSWNARGTWYREAEKNDEKAERAYRKGLESNPDSPLLLHNVAQILVEIAAGPKVGPGRARNLLGEAEALLRTALRADAPRVRRHIHATRDRLHELRNKLPRPKPRGGDRRKVPKKGGKPDRGPRQDSPRQDAPRRDAPRQDGFLTNGKVSLGDMLMAKLKEQDPGSD